MIPHKQSTSSHVAKGPSQLRVRGNGETVLLVEDDRSLRRFMEIVLERAGYKVISATDGLEGVKVAQSSNIDIAITDALMPNMNGYEFCRFMKSNPELSHIPIVLLSALEPIGSERDEPMDAFLVKPVSPEELIECVEGLLEAAGTRA